MGEGARVLGELVALQQPDIGDPLHRPRAHVGGEFLVAEDGEALLQAELEPVPQVMRLPVQLWKYSWAMIASIAA